MKTTLLLLPVLASALFSNVSAAKSVPTTAKLLFQVSGGVGLYDSSNDTSSAVETSVLRAEKAIQDRIEGRAPKPGSIYAGEQEYEPAINVEYQCKNVFYVWSAPIAGTKNIPKGGIFDGYLTYLSASVTVSAYCEPRDFAQKVAISAMQACEKEPKPECMSKEYMDAFNKIQKTNYHNLNKP